jgi:hypothetical protein
MGQAGLDRHQLAGLDDRDRGFSRPVEIERAGDGYRATLRYEALRLITDPQPTPEGALHRLIRTLQARGYRQLKTQMSFRGGLYLGSQELWVEYPDPDADTVRPREGLLAKLVGWFRPRAVND